MAKDPRILVVDDNESLVRLVKGVLEREGYEILTAFDGVEGLELAQREQPNLIILDILMPRMDGYEVCQHLQADPRTQNIPILLLTVKGQLDGEPSSTRTHAYFDQRIQERLAGFDTGAIEFLTKPVKSRELVARVKGLLWLDAG